MEIQMVTEIAELITASHPYLDTFDSAHYPENFAAFAASAAPFFTELSGLSEDELNGLASALADRLEENRKGQSRQAVMETVRKDRQVLALFLTPAALEYAARHPGQESASAFASALNSVWNSRYPRGTYYLGTYADIMDGFHATLFGIPIKKAPHNRTGR